MKTTLKYVLSFCLLFASTWGFCQDRNVIWVHGLNDNLTAWQHYANIFAAERRINSHRQTYSTGSGLSIAASSLRSGLNNAAIHPNNLAIGHSMGGVMIREVDRNPLGGRNFGGYITVASPNYGAQIANSLASGAVQNAANHGVSQLKDGPTSEFLNPVWWIGGIITYALAEYFTNNVNINNLVSAPASRNDLMANSNPINNLNSHNSTLPRISIVAQEASPVHWRLLSTINHDLVNLASSIRNFYEGQRAYHEMMKKITAFTILLGIYHHNVSIAWRRGRDWIDDSETMWNSLIGSTQIQYHTYQVSHWVEEPCPPGFGDPNIIQPPVLDPTMPPDGAGCGYWIHSWITRPVAINFPSDGLLPTHTQELIGVSGGDRYSVNANHLSVLTHNETGNRLNQIFDRSDWFETRRR